MKLKQRFKENPTLYYALSITASWAGVGSLMNFKTLASTNGAIPAILWALGNSLACALFGIFVAYIPNVRKIIKTKVYFYFIAVMTLFQSWTQMNGIREIFSDTFIGTTGGTILAYFLAVFFMILLVRRGMIRNVLTDGMGWYVVYAVIFGLAIASLIFTKGAFNSYGLGLDKENMKVGFTKAFLLLPGPFTYPYFYEIYDYNDKNDDGTKKGNVKKSFILAGWMFGVYMVFSALLAWTQFNPWMNFVKACLIALVGASSLSTYLYSEYIVFGTDAGFFINLFTILGWNFLIPLGVMGVWTLMANIRVYVVAVVLIAALVMRLHEKSERNI